MFLIACACQANASSSLFPPDNPYLAKSSWPIFHKNNYAQASVVYDSIKANDKISIQFHKNPSGGTSPWIVTGALYKDGSQPAYATNNKGVIKYLIYKEDFRRISFLPLNRKKFGWDWNIAVLVNGEVVVTSKKENSIYIVGDSTLDCRECELVVKRKIRIPEEVGELTSHFTVSYEGNVISLLSSNKIAIINPFSGVLIGIYHLPIDEDDVSFHNAFPTDERGRLYLASQKAMTALDWNGNGYSKAWQATYDFRGPGCEDYSKGRFGEVLDVALGRKCTGSGTTPTLIGSQDSGVVVTVDGHSPKNRLVAFWRGTIPPNWQGITGYDKRVAGILELPYSTPEDEGFTAENSPAVFGNAIFIAQWSGFNPDCTPAKGVQRVDWDATSQKLKLVWANPYVSFNGVPTVSAKAGLVYGSGRHECIYHYRGLDMNTGHVKLDIPLGDSDDYNDQGNQQTISDDGSILFSTETGLIRLFRSSLSLK